MSKNEGQRKFQFFKHESFTDMLMKLLVTKDY